MPARKQTSQLNAMTAANRGEPPMRHTLIAAVIACGLLTGCATQALPAAVRGDILVIAHRGASGERPEHTLEAYRLAIQQGADFIEPDLVMSSDGVLFARHDPWLSDSTDIASRPEFAGRKRTLKSPEGEEHTDWWSFDFTAAELKTLRARQVREGRAKTFDGLYAIPEFREIVALAQSEGAARGRAVGLYPETKWPAEHTAEGLDMAAAVVEVLTSAGLNRPGAAVFVQSFEPGILKTLRTRLEVPLIQLVYPENWQPGAPANIALAEIAAYADGVGPYKSLLMDPLTGEATSYAADAKALGLDVHAWTFRDDDKPAWAPTPEDEIRAAVAAGATGVFTDFPATGRRAVTPR
jgi:glycerophosphoryl diester phosphodiesterase